VVCPGARADQSAGWPADWSAVDWGARYDEAAERIGLISERIQMRRPGHGRGRPEAPASFTGEVKLEHEMSEDRYVRMVRRAKEYIAAGDIFQANLSLRVRAGMGGTDPWDAYRLLRGINPSPFAAFMDFGDFFIAGSSPERLVKLSRGGVVETRPIAGTRPRGRDAREDIALRAELLLNEKEKAEHTMLIDLERNDIGKVAGYGSVEVNEFMTTEGYSHVMHIVSNIRGRLAGGKGMFDCLRALFPGGTITGVPKVRCMEIINELEPSRRGPYTGSAGYFGFSGAMDMNIVIRTFLIKDGAAYVQAGAGIVADSVPAREYRESLKKAEALLLALKQAGVRRPSL
nr:anthranilate synthase component I family protein [Nitrospiraceae bacterium]